MFFLGSQCYDMRGSAIILSLSHSNTRLVVVKAYSVSSSYILWVRAQTQQIFCFLWVWLQHDLSKRGMGGLLRCGGAAVPTRWLDWSLLIYIFYFDKNIAIPQLQNKHKCDLCFTIYAVVNLDSSACLSHLKNFFQPGNLGEINSPILWEWFPVYAGWDCHWLQ